MKTANIDYVGSLRTKAVHLRSGTEIITDAPVDNHGKGEAFSPTDLVATGLVSCMISILGIIAMKNNFTLGSVNGSVEKIMAEAPRRIAELNVELTFTGTSYTDSEKRLIENAALNCPVAKSIHPDIRMNVRFNYE